MGTLGDALSSNPKAVVIAAPAHLHISMAIRAAEAGCHLLIEKPLSTDISGVEDLKRRVIERRLIVQVGYTFQALSIGHQSEK